MGGVRNKNLQKERKRTERRERGVVTRFTCESTLKVESLEVRIRDRVKVGQGSSRMAGCINQANVKFANIFRQGSSVYRDLAQDQDQEQDQEQIVEGNEISVEMKSSSDEGEEVGRSFSQTQQNSNRKWSKLAKIAVVIIFVFISGYLLGYVSHRKPRAVIEQVEDGDEETETEVESTPDLRTQPFANWNSVTDTLGRKLTISSMKRTLDEVSSQDHRAGSDEDHRLGQKVLEQFQNLEMDPWMDVHYVKLQVPSGVQNKVLMGSEEVGNPKGYLAYSATGTKQGKVVYANYGRKEDLETLKSWGVNLTENIALVRTGKLSFAEKVANAARFGLAAVLIYREFGSENELNTELYGQVHLGTGDPYTPGFPSFNHTQFPPSKSSGLPEILAQTITGETARKIFQKMGGKDAPADFIGMLPGVTKYTLGGETSVSVSVNNVLVDTKIYNIFGVIKGFVDPDRYVVLGAQRDAFGHGFAKSTVGTSLLLELARAIKDLVRDGFRPRRSIVFASWSGGEFGSVGSTEWLEAYLSSLNLRAFSYISLDSSVTGLKRFKASSSPLLHKLLKNTMDEVRSPRSSMSLSEDYTDWDKAGLEPMKMEDGAFPFLALSGIPSISFRFVSDSDSSDYSGTPLDTREHLDKATESKLEDVLVSAAQLAGQLALRLVHDHILKLDINEYTRIFRINMVRIMREIKQVEALHSEMSAVMSIRWLSSAIGSYSSAVSALEREIQNSDLDVAETCRNINDRIMRVEHNLLSPYVSPRDVPFRHIIFGFGDYSIGALLQHFAALKERAPGSDTDLFRNQFALITWTLQSCANDLSGDVWAQDNLI
ncbi:hypothetical protein HF521_010541 [Silurus meridionalis]|uniref:Transferrin receptor protein 1 n=2 Tax=Silurus meridionalis TaxID=175797 RepID=A0A8T0AJS4_SILME|nr:hypothetical protein HF521_010541 [Silurus meridionalis]